MVVVPAQVWAAGQKSGPTGEGAAHMTSLVWQVGVGGGSPHLFVPGVPGVVPGTGGVGQVVIVEQVSGKGQPSVPTPPEQTVVPEGQFAGQ